MTAQHNQLSPFADGPAANDAAEGGADEHTPPAAPEQAAPAGVSDPAGESAYADTFYGQIGGHATFEKMIHVFYEGIAADPLLRAMYAEEDLGPAERRMLMFMEQYWGGPRTYLEERGHPRLRMRHVPFAVTPEARDRWLAAMRKGVDAVELSPLHEATLWDYLERAAASLVNAPSDPSQRA